MAGRGVQAGIGRRPRRRGAVDDAARSVARGGAPALAGGAAGMPAPGGRRVRGRAGVTAAGKPDRHFLDGFQSLVNSSAVRRTSTVPSSKALQMVTPCLPTTADTPTHFPFLLF